MKQELSIGQRMDAYFRRTDTPIAQFIQNHSPQNPEVYRHSPYKRGMDVGIALPAAIVSAPVVMALGVATKLEDGHSMFYSQDRVGHNSQSVRLVKIRSMSPGSDKNGVVEANGKPAWEHPRNTRIGAFMRRYDLDELPQLWQVVKGEMSLVGIRPLWSQAFHILHEHWSPQRIEKWKTLYNQSSLGLAGVEQVLGDRKKQDQKRYRREAFYAKHESLGFDLYLAWRATARITRILK